MGELIKTAYLMTFLWLLHIVSTSHAYQPSVQLKHNHNGQSYKTESCDSALNFFDKDIVRFDLQETPAQCNCSISLNKNNADISKNESNQTYILTWFGPDEHGNGLTTKFDKYENLLDTSLYNYPLKLSIQPAENPPITFFDNKVDVRRLPFRIFLRGKLKMTCTINTLYVRTMKPTVTDVETLPTAKASTQDGETTETCIYPADPDCKTNSPAITSNPFIVKPTTANHNAVIIGVSFVLIFIIVLASSMILVSLILHRKRLARRLALHLHALEEARHSENLPRSPNDHTNKNVKLLHVRKLITKDQNDKKVQSLAPVFLTDEEPSSTYEEDESSKLIKCNENSENILSDQTGKHNKDNLYKMCTNNSFGNNSDESYDSANDTNKPAQCNGVQTFCNANPDYQHTITANDKTCNVPCKDRGKNNKICNTLDYIMLPQTNVPPTSQQDIYNEPKKDQCDQVYLTSADAKEINNIYITDPTLSHAQMKEQQLNTWKNRKRAKSCSK